MEVKFTTQGKTLIAAVTGELDQHFAASLRDQTDLRISHTNVKRLIFDLSSLEFMDSSGIGVIIGRYKLLRSIGGSVSVVTGRQSVKKLLELSGIGKIMDICESVTDAERRAM